MKILKLIAVYFTVSLILSFTTVMSEEMPSRVSIPLPNGATLDFRAVYLGIDGKQLFDARRIKLGSREPDASYKEQLVDTWISGAFIGQRKGKMDWLYYMGETEIQERHWNALMQWVDEKEGRTSNLGKGTKFPQTKLTIAEIHYFIEHLNSWMLSQQLATLPKYGNTTAFARLPTEAEWAFSARGGIEVLEGNDPELFNRPHPYEDDISSHEWNRINTGGKRVQESASSNIQPNPLGLYDMLGNVRELTINLFAPEYQQGRLGQPVVRGGDYSTSPDEMAVSLRLEYSPYTKDGNIRQPEKIGFRLVLATSISSAGMRPDELDSEYKAYRKRKTSSSGLSGDSSPASQARQDQQAAMRDQLTQLEADNNKLTAQVTKSEQEREILKVEKSELIEKLTKLDKYDTDTKNIELTKLDADNIKLSKKVEDLEQERRKFETDKEQLVEKITELKNEKKNLKATKSQLTEKVIELEKRSSTIQAKSESKKSKLDDNECINAENEGLQERIAQLVRQTKDKQREIDDLQQQQQTTSKNEKRLIAQKKDLQKKVSRLSRLKEINGLENQESISSCETEKYLNYKNSNLQKNIDRLAKQLADKQQEVDDLKRRQSLSFHEMEKNVDRIRIVEKRYLEALMRQSSANAGIAYRQLKKSDVQRKIERVTGKPVNKKTVAMWEKEASQMLSDYWFLIRSIAEETDQDLFPEVKEELSNWLINQEQKGGSEWQRKSLDLIERHVKEIRNGDYNPPKDFVESFTQQSEFQ